MTALLASHPAVMHRPDQGPDDLPSLPPGVVSVGDLAGVVSVVRCRQTSETRIVRHLLSAGVPYYFPRVRRVRYVEGIRRGSYWRAFLPGHLFVGGGQEGREAAADYGRRYANTVYGFLGLPAAETHGLRRDLCRVEHLLFVDPTLDSEDGLRAGTRVRVTYGAYQGSEGTVSDLSARACRVYVLLPTLGQSVPVEVDVDDLERLD